jgi:hypothetical protein
MKINKHYFLLLYFSSFSLMASEHVTYVSTTASTMSNSTYSIPKLQLDEKLISQNDFKSFATTNNLLGKRKKSDIENKITFIKKIDFNKIYIKKPIVFALFPLLNDLDNFDRLINYNNQAVPVFQLSFF